MQQSDMGPEIMGHSKDYKTRKSGKQLHERVQVDVMSTFRQSVIGTYYSFGVELELVLQPKQALPTKLGPDWVDLQQRPDCVKLAFVINASRPGKRPVLAEGTAELDQADSTNTRYQSWTCVQDASIRPGQGQWAVELVSPVLKNTTAARLPRVTDAWVKEVQEVFSIVEENFDIIFSPSCGTHVHVRRLSGSTKAYSLQDLQNISKNIVSWQSVVELCVPDARTNPRNTYCVNNCTRPIPDRQLPQDPSGWLLPEGYAAIRDRSFAPIFQKIDGFTQEQDLIDYMGISKYLAWNFSTIARIGTIEFRLQPMVQNTAETLYSISYALSFINAGATTPSTTWQSMAGQKAVPDIGSYTTFANMMKSGATSGGMNVNEYLGYRNPMYVRQRNLNPIPPPGGNLQAAPQAPQAQPLTFAGGSPRSSTSSRNQAAVGDGNSASGSTSSLGSLAFSAGRAIAQHPAVQRQVRSAAANLASTAAHGAAQGALGTVLPRTSPTPSTSSS